MQMVCIWSSWCHCHPVISCCIRIQNGLPFWYPLTKVVLESSPLYECCFLENTATGLMANYSVFVWQSLPFSCEARLVLIVSETASVCMLLALCWLEVFYIIALYKSKFAYLFADDCRMLMSEVPNVDTREWWRESQCFVKHLPMTKMTGLSLPFMWWWHLVYGILLKWEIGSCACINCCYA